MCTGDWKNHREACKKAVKGKTVPSAHSVTPAPAWLTISRTSTAGCKSNHFLTPKRMRCARETSRVHCHTRVLWPWSVCHWIIVFTHVQTAVPDMEPCVVCKKPGQFECSRCSGPVLAVSAPVRNTSKSFCNRSCLGPSPRYAIRGVRLQGSEKMFLNPIWFR